MKLIDKYLEETYEYSTEDEYKKHLIEMKSIGWKVEETRKTVVNYKVEKITVRYFNTN